MRKYIKPRLNQEHYDQKYSTDNKDKLAYQRNTPTRLIHPSRVMHQRKDQTDDQTDQKNEHFMHKYLSWVQTMEDRDNKHRQHAQKRVEVDKIHKPFKYVRKDNSDLKVKETKIDETTGLMYGLGYDDIISEKVRNSENLDSVSDLNELVNKLGYVDLKDYIALNKYILQAHNHNENINQTKSKILAIAMEKMSQIKNSEALNHIKMIDSEGHNQKARDTLKLDYFFNNFPEIKKLFYTNYYELKSFKEMEENRLLDDFAKFEKMMEVKDETKNTSSSQTSSFNKYMDEIIEDYRQQRTHQIRIDASEIHESLKDIENSNDSLARERVLLMVKYYVFFNKFNKFYIPTDINTEKLIVRFINISINIGKRED